MDMSPEFFDKKSRYTALQTRKGFASEGQQLFNQLHKSITRRFKKRKVYSSFQYSSFGANFEGMQLISECSKGVRSLLICY